MGRLLAHNAVALAFVAAAAAIAISGNDGWGWCIFGAVVTHTTVSTYKRDDDAA